MSLKNYLNRFVVLTLFLSFGCKTESERLPYYNTPDFTPLFLTDEEAINKQITHNIADFTFTNQLGKTISQQEIEGKIHIANFIFTTCGSICPYMTKQLFKAGKQFEKDDEVVILSYSVMPWIDTPEVLKKYKETNQITKKNWHFLTGDKSKIYDLARKSYFAEESLGFTKDSTDFLHTEHFLLVDKNKRIRGIYNGTLALEVEQMIQDVEVLKEE
ncbi:SCO family protein [Flavobacterium sp.]|uniref:SCO family protein n=1 Tax=Flavobacterium sp. TaxID=239 RepID=UPI003D12559F